MLNEGIFDSKQKKEKEYKELIKQIFAKDIAPLTFEIASAVVSLVEDCSYEWSNDTGKSLALANSINKSIIPLMKQPVNKTLHSLVKNIISLGKKYAPNSNELDDLESFMRNVSKLQTSTKQGYKAMEYLLEKTNAEIVKKLDATLKSIEKEHGYLESAEVSTENELVESYRRTVSRGASLVDNELFIDFD